MFRTDLQKKITIAGISLFIIICSLLLAFKVVTFYILWSIIIILPILIASDICFATLPITIPILFGMTGYTLIKRDYEKFNSAYEIILIMITVGIINCEIDWILNLKHYVMNTNCLRLYWYTLLLILFIYGIMYVSRKKDTRLYLLIYGAFILFYLTYKVISAFE